MKVTLLQRNIVWNNPVENRQRISTILTNFSDTDLFVLPEMWTTGFAIDPKNTAEVSSSNTLNWMQEVAAQNKCAICGSVVVKDNDSYYNRLYFVKPDQSVTYYDKRHLFAYGGENKYYNRGNQKVIVNYQNVRILLLVCYDLRFPVWSRNEDDYDMIVYVANWPTSRIDVWNTLLKARALENQCFVVGVNRVGKDPLCPYCGCSVVFDAYGKVLASCERDKECEATVSLDMNKMVAFRKKFPVLNDKDRFNIV